MGNRDVAVLAVLLTTILTAVAPAAARGIHYGAVVDEAVLACDRLHWAGATERSIPCYQDVLASTAVVWSAMSFTSVRSAPGAKVTKPD